MNFELNRLFSKTYLRLNKFLLCVKQKQQDFYDKARGDNGFCNTSGGGYAQNCCEYWKIVKSHSDRVTDQIIKLNHSLSEAKQAIDYYGDLGYYEIVEQMKEFNKQLTVLETNWKNSINGLTVPQDCSSFSPLVGPHGPMDPPGGSSSSSGK